MTKKTNNPKFDDEAYSRLFEDDDALQNSEDYLNNILKTSIPKLNTHPPEHDDTPKKNSDIRALKRTFKASKTPPKPIKQKAHSVDSLTPDPASTPPSTSPQHKTKAPSKPRSTRSKPLKNQQQSTEPKFLSTLLSPFKAFLAFSKRSFSKPSQTPKNTDSLHKHDMTDALERKEKREKSILDLLKSKGDIT